MHILSSARLNLRTITTDDAQFYLELINDPSYIENIGDKGIRTIDAAKESIVQGPVDMQERLGFSLYLVELKPDARPIGICGLIKRDGLANVDLGYGFLPTYTGQGLASEAAGAVLQYARHTLGMQRLVAITAPENARSSRLLEKIGFRFEKIIRLMRNGKEEVNKFYIHEFE
ncbi:GNAT family N-acetyltransferase [Undibacterium sp. Jales W-56]|uniref:GNAT family N-acetyltransferase n=1 Tax=Undibacterium sp. Jales W-56 TaxID=2897325 RepID=UPI0021CE5627|nr:GNAT family N-acetyltransferase [Undibacterium sp. Jales W-56]MCU6433564.1 GNAT family N-acetyltransferase [Undibacterium sp. Jales W-56]